MSTETGQSPTGTTTIDSPTTTRSVYTIDSGNTVDASEWPDSGLETAEAEPRRLYHYAQDTSPDDKRGDGLGGVWHLYEGPTQPASGPPPDPQTGSSSGGDASTSTDNLSDEQKGRIAELDSLLSDGVINQEQYDVSKEKITKGEQLYDPNKPAHEWGPLSTVNLPPGPTQAELDAANAAQGQTADATPEVRPQGFQAGATGQQVSDASKRIDQNVGPTAEEYAAANSEENKKAATEAGFQPNYEVGQRVKIVAPHDEEGRMAYVTRIIYSDPMQEMLAASGMPARSQAEVYQYVVVTRDGRSDVLSVKPNEVIALEENQGWGRGQI